MNEQYEALKKVIQKANPSIMDLKFGCEVEITNGVSDNLGRILKCVYPPDSRGNLTAAVPHLYDINVSINDIKILGRPIRLADVLLAVGKDETDLPNGCACNLCHIPKWKIIHSDITGSSIGWDLKDDNLDNQSDETKVFLINLLCREQK